MISLRNASPAAPIVVVSAAGAPVTMGSAATHEVAGFISKTFQGRDRRGDCRVLSGEVCLPGEVLAAGGRFWRGRGVRAALVYVEGRRLCFARCGRNTVAYAKFANISYRYAAISRRVDQKM